MKGMTEIEKKFAKRKRRVEDEVRGFYKEVASHFLRKCHDRGWKRIK